eukprot:9338580-Pyramimonas_sp.AAC.1
MIHLSIRFAFPAIRPLQLSSPSTLHLVLVLRLTVHRARAPSHAPSILAETEQEVFGRSDRSPTAS